MVHRRLKLALVLLEQQREPARHADLGRHPPRTTTPVKWSCRPGRCQRCWVQHGDTAADQAERCFMYCSTSFAFSSFCSSSMMNSACTWSFPACTDAPTAPRAGLTLRLPPLHDDFGASMRGGGSGGRLGLLLLNGGLGHGGLVECALVCPGGSPRRVIRWRCWRCRHALGTLGLVPAAHRHRHVTSWALGGGQTPETQYTNPLCTRFLARAPAPPRRCRPAAPAALPGRPAALTRAQRARDASSRPGLIAFSGSARATALSSEHRSTKHSSASRSLAALPQVGPFMPGGGSSNSPPSARATPLRQAPPPPDLLRRLPLLQRHRFRRHAGDVRGLPQEHVATASWRDQGVFRQDTDGELRLRHQARAEEGGREHHQDLHAVDRLRRPRVRLRGQMEAHATERRRPGPSTGQVEGPRARRAQEVAALPVQHRHARPGGVQHRRCAQPAAPARVGDCADLGIPKAALPSRGATRACRRSRRRSRSASASPTTTWPS